MKTIQEQVQKEYPDFTGEVDRLAPEQLKARIVALQQALDDSEAHKEANDDLKEAREAVKELSGPYRDVKKAVRLKTRYIIELLKSSQTSS